MNAPPYDLSGHVALITGASRGMGAACARLLAARGYRLALMARGDDLARLTHELGALPFTGSLATPADLERFVHEAHNHYGRIDAVVNNTGHAAKGGLLDLTDADWHAGLDLLFLSVVRMARLVTPIMLAQGTGACLCERLKLCGRRAWASLPGFRLDPSEPRPLRQTVYPTVCLRRQNESRDSGKCAFQDSS